MGQSSIVLVFDLKGNVLALRRGPTDPWMPGRWNFPGGKVDAGESPVEGAYRELAEESGISLLPPSLRWAFTYQAPGRLIHIFYTVLPYRPPVTLPDEEHDRLRWCQLDDIPQPVIPGLNFVVRQFIQLQRRLVAPRLVG